MDGASPQSSGQGSWSWLELGPMELMAVSHAQVSDSQHAAPSHGFQFLCDRRKQLSSTTKAEKSQVKTVTFETASHGSQEQVRGSSKEPFVASRARPSSTGRSSRSSQPINMALQRLSRAQDQWRHRFGHLVGLCNMWPEDELHSSTRYSREVYDPECPGGHHQCPEDAEGALDRGPKAQCQHGEDLHQAGGIFNGDRGAQGQVDPDGGSSPKPKSSPPAAPCRACDPAVRGGSERGPESAVNADRRRNCPAERDCCRTSSSVSHVSARLRGGSDPIPEGTHASKQSLKPDDGAIAMHDGGRLVETDTKMVSLPCDQQHGNSSFALMNAQDNNEPEDASLAEDFELLHFVESKMIGSSSKNHQKQSKKTFATTKNSQKQNKKPLASASTNSMSPPQHMECLREEGNPTVGGSAKFCGLPLKIGRASASLMAMLMLHAQVGLQGLLRGDEPVDCWELFCAPDSWLTAACQSEGLRASRINLHQGYDLYQPSTYDELRERFHREDPNVSGFQRDAHIGAHGLL